MKLRSVPLAMLTTAILVVFTTDVTATTTSGPSRTIDGCSAATQQNASGATSVAILANGTASMSTRPSVVKVQFIDCALPANMDIKVLVPPNSEAATEGTLLEVRNATMQGGSLLVVPTTAATASSSGHFIRNLRIDVADSVLNAATHLLVVNTSSATRPASFPALPTVKNVTLTVRNATLTSQSGDVASVVTDMKSWVSSVHILVGGNTTLQSQHRSDLLLLASISAAKVVGSSLTVDTSSCTGPVTISGGRQDEDGYVGVLSVLHPRHTPTVELHLHDVQILVADFLRNTDTATSSSECAYGTSTVNLQAATQEGVAAVASIALRPLDSASLFLTGTVAIDVQLRAVGATSTPSPHVLTAIGRRRYTGAAVAGIVLVGSSDDYTSTMTIALQKQAVLRLSYNNTLPHTLDGSRSNVLMSASRSSNGESVASVLGIAVCTTATFKPISVAVAVADASTLTIASSITGSGVAMVSETDSSSASSVLGMAVYAYSSRKECTMSLSVSDYSAFNVYGNISTRNTSTHGTLGKQDMAILHAKAYKFAVASVLGIGFSGGSSYTHGSVKVTVTTKSRVNIGSSFRGTGVTVEARGDYFTASAAMGLATKYRCSSKLSSVEHTVSDNSQLNIATSATDDNMYFAALTKNYGTAALFAVAINSYSGSAVATNTFNATGGSNITLASSISGRNITMLSSAWHTQFASVSVCGLAMNSHSSGGASAFTVEGRSRVAILSLIKGATVSAKTITSKFSATSVIGLAVASVPVEDSTGTSNSNITVVTGSSIAIDGIVSDEAVVSAATSRHYIDSVSTTLGIATGARTSGLLTMDDEQPSSALEVWIGAQNSSSITTLGTVSTSAGLLASSNISGLTSGNTNLSFCSDGSVEPALTGTGVILGVDPANYTTAAWHNYTFGNESSALNCSVKADDLEDRLDEAQSLVLPKLLQRPAIVKTPTVSPSTSATWTRSASASLSRSVTGRTPSPTPSLSFSSSPSKTQSDSSSHSVSPSASLSISASLSGTHPTNSRSLSLSAKTDSLSQSKSVGTRSESVSSSVATQSRTPSVSASGSRSISDDTATPTPSVSSLATTSSWPSTTKSASVTLSMVPGSTASMQRTRTNAAFSSTRVAVAKTPSTSLSVATTSPSQTRTRKSVSVTHSGSSNPTASDTAGSKTLSNGVTKKMSSPTTSMIGKQAVTRTPTLSHSVTTERSAIVSSKTESPTMALSRVQRTQSRSASLMILPRHVTPSASNQRGSGSKTKSGVLASRETGTTTWRLSTSNTVENTPSQTATATFHYMPPYKPATPPPATVTSQVVDLVTPTHSMSRHTSRSATKNMSPPPKLRSQTVTVAPPTHQPEIPTASSTIPLRPPTHTESIDVNTPPPTPTTDAPQSERRPLGAAKDGGEPACGQGCQATAGVAGAVFVLAFIVVGAVMFRRSKSAAKRRPAVSIYEFMEESSMAMVGSGDGYSPRQLSKEDELVMADL